ncbi:UNVERIFIED_CONTAM: hypothetical protein ACS92_06355 [Bacillus cereus]
MVEQAGGLFVEIERRARKNGHYHVRVLLGHENLEHVDRERADIFVLMDRVLHQKLNYATVLRRVVAQTPRNHRNHRRK